MHGLSHSLLSQSLTCSHKLPDPLSLFSTSVSLRRYHACKLNKEEEKIEKCRHNSERSKKKINYGEKKQKKTLACRREGEKTVREKDEEIRRASLYNFTCS